jgi:hypothetical protein
MTSANKRRSRYDELRQQLQRLAQWIADLNALQTDVI